MKKISLSKLESFLKARCDDLRAAGLDATEYRDYIIAMIFLKRVNDLFVQRKESYIRELKKQYPDLTDEELALEAEENNSDVYEFYVPLLARWRVEALPVGEHRKFSQQRSEAKGKLEEERIRGEERERWQRQFDEAERMLNWQGLLTVKNDVGDALTIALHEIEDANGQVLSGVLSSTKFNEVNTKGEKKLPDGILVQLINDFNEITLTNDNFEFPDLLGAAYEYLLKYFADIAGKKGGEFYTPSAVVELMGKILQPAKDAEICDPTVGSGGLLINMRNYVESRYGSSRDLSLYGQELIDHTYKMCKMNMIFHGIRDARIEQGDTLLTPKLTKGGGLCKFDIVVANPPFSQNYTTTDMKFKERFRFWMPRKKKADLMFVQHMVATLKAEGRMAVVMPHGVLFRGGEEQRYREELINGQLGCILECVIGLPPELFYGTGIPASILVINRKGAKDRKGVFFINADREYHEGKNQNLLRPEDVEKISYVYTHKCEIPKYSRLVTRQELADEDYNCNIRRYVDNAPDAEPQDVEAHLSGGIPAAEVEALAPVFAPWGDVAGVLFKSQRTGYMQFLKSIKSKEAIAVAVRASEGVGKAVALVEKRVKAFWSAAMPDLEALPKKRDVFALCGKLTELFTAEFGRARHPVLDEFQTRGAFAQYLSDLKNDFKSVANSAWNAELILDDEILESQFPEVLEKLRACEARKAELQGMFDAVDELEEDAWNPEEYEVLPKTELKRIKGEIKDAKGGRKEVEKEIKSLEKRVKACRKAKEDTAALEVEIAGKSAELKPFDERIAALTAQIERHEQLAAELRECNADIRAIERCKDDLVTAAREKISPKEAKELILERWYRTLASTISAYVEAHLRSVIAAVENLHDKYTVPLGALLASRAESTAKLDGFLKELGYSLPEVR